MIDPKDITGLVLAGGEGRRMGGVDKGLQSFLGIPLALHALRRLQPQVGVIALNANRNEAQYHAFCVPVWADAKPDAPSDGPSRESRDSSRYAGPLAGVHAGLAQCTTPWLVTVPCDTPWFPVDLVASLAAAVGDSDIAMAWAPDAATAAVTAATSQMHVALQPQPVFCLLKKSLLPQLTAFLRAGGRKVGAWTQQQSCMPVHFDGPRHGLAFGNANTIEELALLEAWAAQPGD